MWVSTKRCTEETQGKNERRGAANGGRNRRGERNTKLESRKVDKEQECKGKVHKDGEVGV